MKNSYFNEIISKNWGFSTSDSFNDMTLLKSLNSITVKYISKIFLKSASSYGIFCISYIQSIGVVGVAKIAATHIFQIWPVVHGPETEKVTPCTILKSYFRKAYYLPFTCLLVCTWCSSSYGWWAWSKYPTPCYC